MNWKFWDKNKDIVEPNTPSVTWRWSDNPGGYERHIQRRWNNPLFPKERRQITADDVYSARAKDEQAISPLVERVASIQRDWPAELPLNFLSWCHETRETVDNLLSSYYKIGGNADVLKLLQHMRHCVISTWRTGRANNPEGLSALEEAEKEMAKWGFLDNTFVAQSTIDSIYIPADELLPALLSEPVDNIRAYCEFITLNLSEEESIEKLTLLRNASLDLIRIVAAELLGRNDKVPSWDDKLEAMSIGRA